jgi:hypothetical protein
VAAMVSPSSAVHECSPRWLCIIVPDSISVSGVLPFLFFAARLVVSRPSSGQPPTRRMELTNGRWHGGRPFAAHFRCWADRTRRLARNRSTPAAVRRREEAGQW